jgi:hypothetical protein
MGKDQSSVDEKQRIFDEGMERLAQSFGIELSVKRAAIYWEVLSKYPQEKLELGLRQALECERFFPSIAAIRSYIDPLGTKPEIPTDTQYKRLA